MREPKYDSRALAEPAVAASATSTFWHRFPGAAVVFPLLLVAAGFLGYRNSFDGIFLFDDQPHIVDRQEIRRLWPFTGPGDLFRSGSLVTLSLSANYALGGLRPWGYHLFNLAVHLLAGLALYGLVRRTLLLLPRYRDRAAWLALAVALLWLVHPLQTESVTYVVQRAEALMGLFYLLTLYCTLRGAAAVRASWLWYGAAVACCVLGMASKEVMCTAPLLVLLYDRVFLAPGFRTLLRRRWGLYAGLFASWALLASRVMALFGQSPETASVGFTLKGVTALEYARTQPGVILHYLRLVFWPDYLCLDYGWPVARTAQAIVPAAVAVAALAAAAAWALWRRPALGFCGVAFFLTLAPTSSVVPMKDLAFEHRTYLPLAAVVVLVVVAVEAVLIALLPRLALPYRKGLLVGAAAGGVGLVLLLAARTASRNEDYRSLIVMWRNAVARQPLNARAHNNLGVSLSLAGELSEASAHFGVAVRLDPGNAMVHHNLGHTLFLRDIAPEESVAHLREAIRLQPDFSAAYFHLAEALAWAGKLKEALDAYRETVRLDPDAAVPRYRLGYALLREGRVAEAIEQLREAVRRDPNLAFAHRDLGAALLKQGKPAEALQHLRNGVRLMPNDATMHNSLGLAYLRLGNRAQAEAAFGRAVALAPRQPGFHLNLAYTLSATSRSQEAMDEYRVALRLNPDWPRTRLAEAWTKATHPDARKRDGRSAVWSAEQVLHVKGDRDPRVLDTLAAARAETGQFAQAVEDARRALARAREAGQGDVAEQIEGRLALYQKQRPFRSSAAP